MHTGTRPVRVLIVDDSALIRAVLRAALLRHPGIEVVGQAANGIEALAQIQALRPDVVTLDVEMPQLSGLGVLDRVVGRVAVAFLMVSTLTQAGAQVTFEALRRGAVDFITKPQADAPGALPAFQRELVQKVLAAARARRRRSRALEAGPPAAGPTLPPNPVRGWVVAIGISCGGPQTLYRMLPAFPSDFVPIVITQHMPPGFTAAFAGHLSQRCAMRVREARHGEPIEHGTILIAPGSHHLRLVRRGVQLHAALDRGPPIGGHRPSVDALLASVAAACGRRAVGVIMTGMGRDGAEGIVAMRQAGAATVAQDEESSYVYGMPRAAVATGSVQHVAPAERIPALLARLIQGERVPAAAGG